MMMKHCWFQLHRKLTPVLVTISCLCLALGSCFPSSDPLNRLPENMDHKSRRTRHGAPTQIPTALEIRSSGLKHVGTRQIAEQFESTENARFSSQISNSRDLNNIPVELPPTTAQTSHTSDTNMKVKNVKSVKKKRNCRKRKKDCRRNGLEPRAGLRHNKRSIQDCRNLSRAHRLKTIQNDKKVKLAVYEDGTVNGTTTDDVHAVFQVSAIRGLGVVRLFGFVARMYVCMDSRGVLYGSREALDDCLFIEDYHDPTLFRLYYSAIHPQRGKEESRWYIGLNKHGVAKRGKRVEKFMKIAHFSVSSYRCSQT